MASSNHSGPVVHTARANGLNKETEEPGECQDDKSTTCGGKRAGGNKEAQGDSNSNPSGQNDVQSSTTTVGRKIRGVPKNQGMRLQDLLHNGQKRCISLS